MRHAAILATAGIILAGTFGCSHRPPVQTVAVPPLIDLKQHEMIGVVEFSTSADGKLGPLATRRFTQWARHDQGLVRIIELGSKKKAMGSVGRDRWDAETFKVLGQQRGVKTLMVGELKISDIRPDIKVLASLGSGHVSAQVNAVLEVQLIETATGASLWSSSAAGTRSVGSVSMFSGGRFSFDADDPDRAYGEMVDSLVEQTTRDFRISWVQR